MKILQLQYFARRRVPTLDNYLRQGYLIFKTFKSKTSTNKIVYISMRNQTT
jgi:hypothetical protein